MRNPVLLQALNCAIQGWPVFPCQPGRKTPATPHGHLDATTDHDTITDWFARHPDRNLAVATGDPGPDVLDIDYRGPGRSGFPALTRLAGAGLLGAAVGAIRTPSGGLHLYFAGSDQRSGHVPAAHIDFLARGGYILIPPSQVNGKPYHNVGTLRGPGHGRLDWQAVAGFLEPSRTRTTPEPRHPAGGGMNALARWVAAQREGNRNAGLFWAANRALETNDAADLSPLAAAARQAGLDEPEITRTLNSARKSAGRTGQYSAEPPDRHPEGAS